MVTGMLACREPDKKLKERLREGAEEKQIFRCITRHTRVPPATAALLILILPMTPANPSQAATIYRCFAEGQPPLYSDYPCKNAVSHRLSEPSGLSIPPLSAAERTRLKALAKRQEISAARHSALGKQRQRQIQATRTQRRQNCAEARQKLKEHNTRRRQGYRLADSRQLAKTLNSLKQQRRNNC